MPFRVSNHLIMPRHSLISFPIYWCLLIYTVCRQLNVIIHGCQMYKRTHQQWRIQGGGSGHPGSGSPPSVLSNFSQVKKIISYDRATTANFVYLFWGLNAMGNGHSFCFACALENQSFNINFTRHASLYTLQHTHVSMTLYFIIS